MWIKWCKIHDSHSFSERTDILWCGYLERPHAVYTLKIWDWSIAKCTDIKISKFTKYFCFRSYCVGSIHFRNKITCMNFSVKFPSIFKTRYFTLFVLSSFLLHTVRFNSVSQFFCLVSKSITSVVATFKAVLFPFKQNENLFSPFSVVYWF